MLGHKHCYHFIATNEDMIKAKMRPSGTSGEPHLCIGNACSDGTLMIKQGRRFTIGSYYQDRQFIAHLLFLLIEVDHVAMDNRYFVCGVILKAKMSPIKIRSIRSFMAMRSRKPQIRIIVAFISFIFVLSAC